MKTGPVGSRRHQGSSIATRSCRPTSCASQRQDLELAPASLSPAMPLHYDGVRTDVRLRNSHNCDRGCSDRYANAQFDHTVIWNAEELGGGDRVARHHQEQPVPPPWHFRYGPRHQNFTAEEVARLHGIEGDSGLIQLFQGTRDIGAFHEPIAEDHAVNAGGEFRDLGPPVVADFGLIDVLHGYEEYTLVQDFVMFQVVQQGSRYVIG